MFLGADNKSRLSFSLRLKICMRCLDATMVLTPNDLTSCKVVCEVKAGKAKPSLTCKEGNCTSQGLVSFRHNNTSILEDMKRKCQD